MAKSNSPREDKASSLKKDSDAWTGDVPMTSAQAFCLKTLYEEAGEAQDFDADLSKAEASSRIDQICRRTAAARPASSP